MIFMDDNLTW